MQFIIIFSPEYLLGGERGNFLTRVSFWGGTGEFLWILLPEYLFGGERGGKIKNLLFYISFYFGNFQPNAAKFPTIMPWGIT